MKKILIFIIIASLAACKTQSHFNVVPVSDIQQTEEKKEGVYYALPRTHIAVDVSVVKTQSSHGPFAEYASRYLGIENVISENSSSYEIRDIKISTFFEPDPEQFYFVEFGESGQQENSQIMMELTESGLIVDVNSPSEFHASGRMTYTMDEESNDYSASFNYFPDQNLYEKVDTIIQEITRDTVTFERKILKRKLVEKSTRQKAKEAADFIRKLRNQKMNLITGYQETPYSKEALEYMYEELESIENEYLKLFTGMKTTQVINYRYFYLPPSNIYNVEEPLFRFSTKQGVVETDSDDGHMVYLQVERQRNAHKMLEHIKSNFDSGRERNGFYYRMPEYARLTVKQGTVPRVEALYPISQFGVINSLPPGYNKIKFYPSSGMIRTIDIDEEK
ncbi:MAG: DUF4831 family protein [Bacteroidota bacterium]